MSGEDNPKHQEEGSSLLGNLIRHLSSEPQPSPEIIPKKWRIPFFVALTVISLLLLLAVIVFVVVPGVRSMQDASTLSEIPIPRLELPGRIAS